jgi:hypothetical protein
MEARYTNRFRSIEEKTGSQIKNRDAAGNLTEHITHARGSIAAQQQNIRELFATSREMITGINTHQNMIGVDLVKNLPLPGPVIQDSMSNQLGYVQLTMRFMQAGMLHFMEQVYNAQIRISELESTLEKLAQYDDEMTIIGKMNVLDIDSLELTASERPPSPPDSVTSQPIKKTGSKSEVSSPTVTSQPTNKAAGVGKLRQVSAQK